MKEQNLTRQSNFEFMRIISMFMIVFWHFFRNSNAISNYVGTSEVLMILIQCLFCIHVNSFVLLSGYFQCEKKIKFSKVISVNNAMWFYKSLIPIVLLFIGQIDNIDLISFLKNVSPITHYDYWFMTIYLLLYLISPILNTVINNIDRKKHKYFIALLFIILCVLPTITAQQFYNNNSGYSLGNFILLYFIGAYIKKYPIDNNRIFYSMSTNSKRLLFLSLFFFIAFISCTIQISSKTFLQLGTIMNNIGNIINKSFTSYDNPLVVIQSVFYFLFFSTLNFKNKIINRIARTCMGIYLIHNNKLLISKMYDWFNLNVTTSYNSFFILNIFIFTVIVFICCFIIESVRMLFFDFVYNRNICKKIRFKYRNYIKSLGIDVNW